MGRLPVANSSTKQSVADERRLRELDRKADSLIGSFTDLHPWMTPPVASLYCTAVISVPTATWTTIPMDSVAIDSDGGFGSNGYVCKRDGIYAVSVTAPIGGATAGKRACAIALNGARLTGGDPNYGDSPSAPFKVVALVKGDVITVQFVQNSGTTWTSQGGTVNAPAIDLHWIRPLLGPVVHAAPYTPPNRRAYFTAADWMWNQIPANPRLDPNSAAMVATISNGAQVVDSGEFGNVIIDQSQILPGTPRYTIPLTAGWGSVSQFTNVPIPNGTVVATGSDKGMGIWDPTTNLITSLWVAQPDGHGGWTAEAGSQLPVTSDGRETGGDTSTGSDLARFGCVVRKAEIAAGAIEHALFFSSNAAMPSPNGPNFRYPATKTDGQNFGNKSVTIQEGTRFQLDPSINLASIPGITPLELAVGVAMQRYGGYMADNGGAEMAFAFELGDYSAYGATGDYYQMSHIPWGQMWALATWNGT